MTQERSTTVTFGVLLLAVGSFAMLQSLIVPVMPRLQAELGTDQTTITWVLTAYLISASVATPLAGRTGDVVGKKRMLVVGLVSLAVGSAVAASVHDVRWLIAARVLQGVGGSVIPMSFGIIREQFGERMGHALAMVASFNAVGFGVGIVTAGPVYDLVGYRGLFLLPLAITLLTAVAAALVVPETRHRSPDRPPLTPAVLLSVALIGILLAVSQSSTWGPRAPHTLAAAGVGLLATAGWALLELRARVPLVDLRLMRRRGLWTCNVVMTCLGFSLFAAFAFLPQLLQTPASTGYGLGADLKESGFLLLPWAFGTFLAGSLTMPLVRRTSARGVIALGSLGTGVAFAGLAAQHGTAWQIGIWTTLQGLGSGLATAALAGVVVSSVRFDQTGVASGMNANFRSVGGAFGAAVMGAIVTAHPGAGEFPQERGYVVGFGVLAGVMLVAAAVAALVPDAPVPQRSALAEAGDAGLGLVAAAPATADLRPGRRRATRSDRRSRTR